MWRSFEFSLPPLNWHTSGEAEPHARSDPKSLRGDPESLRELRPQWLRCSFTRLSWYERYHWTRVRKLQDQSGPSQSSDCPWKNPQKRKSPLTVEYRAGIHHQNITYGQPLPQEQSMRLRRSTRPSLNRYQGQNLENVEIVSKVKN